MSHFCTHMHITKVLMTVVVDRWSLASLVCIDASWWRSPSRHWLYQVRINRFIYLLCILYTAFSSLYIIMQWFQSASTFPIYQSKKMNWNISTKIIQKMCIFIYWFILVNHMTVLYTIQLWLKEPIYLSFMKCFLPKKFIIYK
jgi:hypothetical protein